MNKLLVCLFAFLLGASAVDACGRRSRGGGGGNLNFASRNPIVITPTPAPTPPPPPPPLPNGWVLPPPNRPDAQFMSRTNCEADITFVIPANSDKSTLNRIDIQEQWLYTCRFNVYVEIDIGTTSQKQNCACGAWFGKVDPVNDTFERSLKTEITDFSFVAFDYRAKVPGDSFNPEIAKAFTANSNTTNTLTEAASSTGMVYSGIAKGWAGELKKVTEADFPSQMQKGNPKFNPNYVPAMCFAVTEEYLSTYKWPEPPYPLMHTVPNMWMTDCVAWTEYAPKAVIASTLFKRGAEQGIVVPPTPDGLWQKFYREFLLFPLQRGSSVGGQSGFVVNARYMTSFYNDSNCGVGLITFDRSFSYTLARDRKTFGAFIWTRNFKETRIIGGAPKTFSGQDTYAALGFTKVTWNQIIGEVNGNYRRGVIYDILSGTATSGEANLGPKSVFCVNVPEGWKNCTGGATDCAIKNAEGAWAFVIPETAASDFGPARSVTPTSMTCQPYYRQCRNDKTRLSFQNFGSLARDYAKRRTSILLTGPRKDFCTETPEEGFDTLLYVPIVEDKAIRKRAVSQSVQELSQMLPVSRSKTTGQDLFSPQQPPLDTPGVNEKLIRAGIGSADEFGKPAGDHPVGLFPETYTAPVTVNPADASFDGVNAAEWQGTASVCLEGSLGCSCRLATSRVACDAPLECNGQNFCARPACPAGSAGCPCSADGTCAARSHSCRAGVCVFTPTCTAGSIGCSCDGAACNGAGSVCSDCDPSTLTDVQRSTLDASVPLPKDTICPGVCLNSTAGFCDGKAGSTGCPCGENGACKSTSDICDPVTRMCQAPTCSPGAAGCFCAENNRCSANFECSEGRCIAKVCPQGKKGCLCDVTSGCSEAGYACKAVNTDNTEFRCIGKPRDCGDLTNKCKLFCGASRVLSCPSCSDQRILCKTAAAGTLAVPSVAILVILAILGLFL